MNRIKHYIFVLACVLLSALSLVACSDNEGGGTPEILSICSTSNLDSTYTEAQPGQMVMVQGRNLGGVKKVMVNGQESGINLTLCTSTHIIMTIPSDVQLYGEHASFKNEIVVETDHGTANYQFDVLAPAPSISRYEAEWVTVGDQVGLIPGQKIEVYGSNFYRINRVYLTDASGKEVDVAAFEVNATYNQITVTLPQDVFSGDLVVECKSGTASCSFSASLPMPEITDLSSEMPIPGSTVTIKGRNFLEVESINVNDEYKIAASDIEVAQDHMSLSFVLPKSAAKDGFIEVVTKGGKARTDFYPSSSVFLNFDDKTYTSYWWGESNVSSDDTKMGPKVSSGKYAGVEGVVGSQWWWGVIACVGGLQAPTDIAGTISLDDLELRFECYVVNDLLGTKYKATFNDLEITEPFELVDRTTGKTELGKWMTVSVPLNKWMSGSYADFLTHWNGNFNLNTNPSAEAVSHTLANYFDNFRIVKSK